MTEATEKKTRIYGVYREKSGNWMRMGQLETEGYYPSADEIGKAHGEGKYLLIEETPKDSSLNRFVSGQLLEIEATTYYNEVYRTNENDEEE